VKQIPTANLKWSADAGSDERGVNACPSMFVAIVIHGVIATAAAVGLLVETVGLDAKEHLAIVASPTRPPTVEEDGGGEQQPLHERASDFDAREHKLRGWQDKSEALFAAQLKQAPPERCHIVAAFFLVRRFVGRANGRGETEPDIFAKPKVFGGEELAANGGMRGVLKTHTDAMIGVPQSGPRRE
jgi:hypothetical protein